MDTIINFRAGCKKEKPFHFGRVAFHYGRERCNGDRYINVIVR
jgi:hypothetical protein